MVNAHADAALGGAEKHLHELAAGLTRGGHEVHLFQAFPDREGVAFPGRRDVLHRSDWRTSDLRRLRNRLDDVLSLPRERFRAVVEARAPDVVHTHNLPGFGTGIWETCRRLGIPVVHTLHDYYLLCPRVTLVRRDGTPCRPSPLVCGLRARRLARHGAAVGDVVGVSQHILDRHRAVFPSARAHVIRNRVAAGADIASSPPAERLRTVGYIGSLDYVKGVHVLLEAAPDLLGRECTVALAGAGRLQAEVETAAARGLVRYFGHVAGAEKRRFFELCDLGVVPSVWEEPGGPTYTMAEWLSSGRPLAVSRRGGLGEALAGLPGAFAIEPTASALVAAVERLLDPEAWRAAVAAVRPPATGSLEEWTEAYLRVYEGAIGAGAGRR